jgi:hypothetical protein
MVQVAAETERGLWRKFIDECLGLLVQQHDEKNGPGEVKVGDELLIGYDNKKSLDWPLGLDVCLFPVSESEDSPRGIDQTSPTCLSITDKTDRSPAPYP